MRGKEIAGWILSILLTLVFLFAGGSKLAGMGNAAAMFEHWGYPRWFAYVTGSIEVVGAVLLLVPKTWRLAAYLLGCTMVGAVYTHLRAHELSHAPGPAVLLALLVLTVWLRMRRPA